MAGRRWLAAVLAGSASCQLATGLSSLTVKEAGGGGTNAMVASSSTSASAGGTMCDGSGGCGGGEKVVELAAGSDHACARFASGRVKCWGRNDYGQLGIGDVKPRGAGPGQMGAALPFVDLGLGAKSLGAGDDWTCAILDDDTLKCWGRNDVGQLGLGDTLDHGDDPGEMGSDLPAVDLGAKHHAIQVVAGAGHTCALLDDHGVKCWGRGLKGALGQANFVNHGDQPLTMGKYLAEIDLGTGRTAKAIASEGDTVCAVLDDDRAKCWGSNDHGQIGVGNTKTYGANGGTMGDSLPAIDFAGAPVAAITPDDVGASSCALLAGGAVRCSGNGADGALGQGSTTSLDKPSPALDLGVSPAALLGGGSFFCAVTSAGAAKCWGGNAAGELGQGDAKNRGDDPGEMGAALAPIDLGKGRTVRQLAAGSGRFACALLDDDSVKCWGGNAAGELGQGDTKNRGDEPGEMGDALKPVQLL